MCAVTVGVIGMATAGGVVEAAGAAPASHHPGKTAAADPVTTADVSFSVSLSGLTASPVTITGSGEADFSNDAVFVSATLPPAVAQLLPGGSTGPEVVNAVYSDGTIYLEIPSLSSLLGAPWISVALPTTATKAVPGIFTKVAGALGDVNSIVSFATAHHATVTSLGSSTVDGVSANGTQIVATLPGKGGAGTLTASLWADSSDRLVQGDVAVTGSGTKGPIGLTGTVDLSGYGSPVTVTVPPASEVRAVPYATVAHFLGTFLHHGRRL